MINCWGTLMMAMGSLRHRLKLHAVGEGKEVDMEVEQEEEGTQRRLKWTRTKPTELEMVVTKTFSG